MNTTNILKQISGRGLYVIIGALALMFFSGNISKVFEYEAAYKHPAINSHSTTSSHTQIKEKEKMRWFAFGHVKLNWKDNGDFSLEADKVSFNDDTASSSNTSAVSNSITSSTPILPITNRGAIFALYDPLALRLYPTILGASYPILGPIDIVAQYNIDVKSLYVGPKLGF